MDYCTGEGESQNKGKQIWSYEERKEARESLELVQKLDPDAVRVKAIEDHVGLSAKVLVRKAESIGIVLALKATRGKVPLVIRPCERLLMAVTAAASF